MYKILSFSILVLLLFQYFGLYYTTALGSTDFLFSPQKDKTNNVSILALESEPSLIELEEIIDLLNKESPTVIGLNLVGAPVLAERPNIVSLDLFRNELYTDSDGKVRAVHCPSSFVHEIAKKVNPFVECLNEQLTINYSLNRENMEVITLHELRNGKIPTAAVVLVGLDTTPDRIFVTPMPMGYVSDVIVNANAINTIITARQIITLPQYIVLSISAVVYVLFGLVVLKIKFLRGLGALLVFAFIYLLAVWVSYLNNVLIDFFYIPVGLVTVYICLLAWGYFDQYKSKTFIQNAFGKYLSSKVLDQLLADPKKLELGGERKILTILFVDIRSFTQIAETTRTDRLVKILNSFLSFVTETVIQEDGTLDKYVGDEVIAFWNAPLDQANHASLAASAAVRIKNGLEKVIDGGVGIGLNTGLSFVGNVGSQHLYDYTAIGDTVNITSRLEQLTRVYGVSMLASESFVKAVQTRHDEGVFQFRKLDILVLKGKSNPVVVYELVGFARDITDEQKNLIKEYEYALYLYFEDKYSEAERILRKFPNDEPSKHLLKKIMEIQKRKEELVSNV